MEDGGKTPEPLPVTGYQPPEGCREKKRGPTESAHRLSR